MELQVLQALMNVPASALKLESSEPPPEETPLSDMMILDIDEAEDLAELAMDECSRSV